jgi:hypothetical protein
VGRRWSQPRAPTSRSGRPPRFISIHSHFLSRMHQTERFEEDRKSGSSLIKAGGLRKSDAAAAGPGGADRADQGGARPPRAEPGLGGGAAAPPASARWAAAVMLPCRWQPWAVGRGRGLTHALQRKQNSQSWSHLRELAQTENLGQPCGSRVQVESENFQPLSRR